MSKSSAEQTVARRSDKNANFVVTMQSPFRRPLRNPEMKDGATLRMPGEERLRDCYLFPADPVVGGRDVNERVLRFIRGTEK